MLLPVVRKKHCVRHHSCDVTILTPWCSYTQNITSFRNAELDTLSDFKTTGKYWIILRNKEVRCVVMGDIPDIPCKVSGWRWPAVYSATTDTPRDVWLTISCKKAQFSYFIIDTFLVSHLVGFRDEGQLWRVLSSQCTRHLPTSSPNPKTIAWWIACTVRACPVTLWQQTQQTGLNNDCNMTLLFLYHEC